MKNHQQGISTVSVLVIIIVILVIVGIVFAGWYWYKNYYPNNALLDGQNLSTIQTTLSTTTSPTIISDQAPFKLDDSNSTFYHNIGYGYGINYPNTWKTQGATQESDLAQFYTDSIDIINEGALVSISSVEDTGDIIDIRKWSSSQSVEDPEGADAKKNAEYLTKNGMTYLKNESKMYHSLTYYWICGFRVMTITYQADSTDHDKHLPTFNAIFDTLIPCAE